MVGNDFLKTAFPVSIISQVQSPWSESPKLSVPLFTPCHSAKITSQCSQCLPGMKMIFNRFLTPSTTVSLIDYLQLARGHPQSLKLAQKNICTCDRVHFLDTFEVSFITGEKEKVQSLCIIINHGVKNLVIESIIRLERAPLHRSHRFDTIFSIGWMTPWCTVFVYENVAHLLDQRGSLILFG